jgi:hypothetical protein
MEKLARQRTLEVVQILVICKFPELGATSLAWYLRQALPAHQAPPMQTSMH